MNMMVSLCTLIVTSALMVIMGAGSASGKLELFRVFCTNGTTTGKPNRNHRDRTRAGEGEIVWKPLEDEDPVEESGVSFVYVAGTFREIACTDGANKYIKAVKLDYENPRAKIAQLYDRCWNEKQLIYAMADSGQYGWFMLEADHTLFGPATKVYSFDDDNFHEMIKVPDAMYDDIGSVVIGTTSLC